MQSHDGELKEWDAVSSLEMYLEKFKHHLAKYNDACDAEQDSYDAAILLTGRADDLTDVGPGATVGFAYTGKVCDM